MAASTVRAGFADRAHSGVQISYRATKKYTSGFFEHRGCLRQVGVFIRPAGTLEQRRACSRRDDRGIGPSDAGLRSSHRWAQFSFAGSRVFQSSALVSTTVPGIIAIGSGTRSQSRGFAGYSPRHALANVWLEDRSFEPSNDALQPTSSAVASG